MLYELAANIAFAIPNPSEVMSNGNQCLLGHGDRKKKATAYQRDLALDWGGIALILDLLEERDEAGTLEN